MTLYLPDTPDAVRQCRVCGETKPLRQFALTVAFYRPDGTAVKWRKHTCYTCRNARRAGNKNTP